MKIKEVCERTGLTERTVRFYMQKGLIAPKGELRNGREYSEFSETDVEMLQDLVISAVNEALRQAEEAMESAMGSVTGGLNIPGLF